MLNSRKAFKSKNKKELSTITEAIYFTLSALSSLIRQNKKKRIKIVNIFRKQSSPQDPRESEQVNFDSYIQYILYFISFHDDFNHSGSPKKNEEKKRYFYDVRKTKE